jgi:hypothetical protein
MIDRIADSGLVRAEQRQRQRVLARQAFAASPTDDHSERATIEL